MEKSRDREALPDILRRPAAAAFLGISEKEMCDRAYEPGFPRHTTSWTTWFYLRRDLEAYKAKNRGENKQLDLLEVIRTEVEDEPEITPAMERYLARMEAKITARVTAKVFYRENRYAV